MTYKDILQSDFFFDTYSQIEFMKREYPVNHGFVHVWHVITWAKKLAKIFRLSEEETNLLLIAASLHDIGYIKGRENHAQSGAMLAREYLDGKLTQVEVDRICNAIASHGGDFVEDFTDNISMCLVLSDKFDFDKTRYRVDENYKSTTLFNSIEKLEFEKNENDYSLNIYTTRDNLYEEIKDGHFFGNLRARLDTLYDARNIRINTKFIRV